MAEKCYRQLPAKTGRAKSLTERVESFSIPGNADSKPGRANVPVDPARILRRQVRLGIRPKNLVAAPVQLDIVDALDQLLVPRWHGSPRPRFAAKRRRSSDSPAAVNESTRPILRC